MNSNQGSRAISRAILAIAAILVVRLATLSLPDLIDTTEGRYASVAKLMLEHDDWLSPRIFFQGVDRPYNGKPALHFLLMVVCYCLLGINAFAARLPGVLAAVGIGFLIFALIRRILSLESALTAVAVLSTSALLYFLSGACVLDVSLTFGITMALVGFALADRSRLWSNLFFAGIGLGVLVKGPIAGALVVLSLLPWIALQRWATGKLPDQFRALRWIEGPAVFLLVAAPLYLMQEARNPGFLHYFIWNENIQRYLVKDYGDAYGTGHSQPFGASWLMLFLGLIPWSLIALPALTCMFRVKGLEQIKAWLRDNPWALFGATWMASCPFLFTFARQYTGTYLVPSVPGFAVFVAALWHSTLRDKTWQQTPYFTTCKIAILALGIISIVGSLVSLRMFGAPWESVLAACTIGLAVVYRSTRIGRAPDQLTSITEVILATVALYAAVVLCFSNFISDNRSSRRVLEAAQRLLPGRPEITVGFPYYYPFSATFYGSTVGSKPIQTRPLKEEELTLSDDDLLIVRGDNAQRILAADPRRQVLDRVGKWTIFANKAQNPR